MDNEIFKMINELEKRGWKVIRLSEAMKRDVEECEEMELKGENKECFGCSCSVCLMQTH